MESILSRIQEIASSEGITIGALERKIGASKGVLSRAINNGTDIQSKWVQIIVENYPQYSTRWLMTGEGDMIAKNSNIQQKNDTIPPYILDMLSQKDEMIRQQAEEIGRLKARIDDLVHRLEKDARNASIGNTANAG